MANKPVTTTVAAGAHYSAATLNENFEKLSEAVEGCLGRGGTSENPNSMSGDLDLNLNSITNVKDFGAKVVRTGQLFLGSGEVLESKDLLFTQAEVRTLVDGQVVVSFTNPVTKGVFYINGDCVDNGRLRADIDYSKNLENNEVVLAESYPSGTTLTMVYLEEGVQA